MALNVFWIYVCLSCGLAYSAEQLKFKSDILKETRELTIYTPDDFDSSRAYPVIYVLDGHYLGGIVQETNQYLAHFDRTLPVITVSIHQDTTRWSDCAYNWRTSELKVKGIGFYAFLTEELVPFVRSNYKTTSYSVLVGHSYTATYVCLDWVKTTPFFSAHIAMSPYLPTDLKDKMLAVVHPEETQLSIITSENDLSLHKSMILDFQKKRKQQKRTEHEIYIRNAGEKSHATLVPVGLEISLNELFQDAQSLFNQYAKIRKMSAYPVYTKTDLLTYYERIQHKYGIAIFPWLEDMEYAFMVLERNKNREDLLELANWVIREFPDSYAGYYGLGAYYEKKKDYAQALVNYELGYTKLGEECLNKIDFWRDVERLRGKVKGNG